jgi:hypothetical protein
MPLSELEGSHLPKFDWTINLGHVLTIAAVLGTMATAYTTYQVTISDHDARIRSLEKTSQSQDARMSEQSQVLYSIKQDLAIIKYRLEADDRTKTK